MDPTESLAGRFAARYVVERELGRGSTATVFLARDQTNGQPVALKILRTELAETVAADRFLREIKVNERLHHPRIVPVLDSGNHAGELFFVLPYMDGGSLRDVLQREKQLSIELAVSIARTIAGALDYAHRDGLIHRDVKPENILFSSGEACLADFGIARAIERAASEVTTETGVVRGTPAYMSPEQASGDRNYDGRSDQYSLACVLYEMLAGVPAFHGATPEATVALRFHHRPHGVRVYRPSVPVGVDDIIQRAMSIVPADRYSTIGEFSSALEAAMRVTPVATTVSAQALPGGSTTEQRDRKRTLIGATMAIVALAATGVYFAARAGANPASLGDSTRVVVFPFESAGTASSVAPHELLHTALRRWQGITVVPIDQTIDALRKRGTSGRPTPDDMRSVATALGARRFVVGKVMRTPTGYALFAEYRDAASGSLHSAQLDLPSNPAGTARVYAALADSLVLRGASDGSDGSDDNRPKNLFAMQAFIREMAARDEWDLPRADSLLGVATSLDPQFTRGLMWRAQVKAWRGLKPEQWIALAERALADSVALARHEQIMIRALVLLGRGDYPAACAVYRELVKEDDRSFAGWYGLAECNQNDRIVIPDPRSPSAWAFRSSYREAVKAYTRAFQLIPATYRGFQASNYARLRELLFTSVRQFRAGYALNDSKKAFLGAPVLDHDTLTVVPWERDAVFSGKIRASASATAIQRLRSTFDSIAVRWASAFPHSADAKEAFALSLELRGEPAALDTMAAAERLAVEGAQRIRFAVARTVLQLKFGIDRDQSLIDRARVSADSLLQRYAGRSTPEVDGLLAPIAAMTGRCAQASSLLKRSATSIQSLGVRYPQDIVADAWTLQGAIFVGCSPSDVWSRVADIDRRISVSANSEPDRLASTYLLFGGIVLGVTPPDSVWSARFAGRSPTLAAWNDVRRGDSSSARARLDKAAALALLSPSGETSPQRTVAEARLRLEMRDTANAVTLLERAIRMARNAPPLSVDQPSDNTARIGYLVQAIALYARLASRTNPLDARVSARAAIALWSNADVELQPLVARLREIAK